MSEENKLPDHMEAATEEQIEQENLNLRKKDLVFAGILLVITIFYFIGALRMPVDSVTGDPDKWFTAPAVFPIIVSIGLFFTLGILLFQVISESKGINREDVKKAMAYFRTDHFRRFSIATGLLILYIYVMLGRVQYEISTFLYLFATMMIFRDEKLNWKVITKITLISGLTAFVVGYSFSHFALIPLP